MHEVQVYTHDELGSIRTLNIDGEPWFVGKDVAAALAYGDTTQAIRKHVDSEDKLTRQIDSSGQKRNVIVINESGLYGLILSSKLPSAKKFKRWVTSEVLPDIRKLGVYSTNGVMMPHEDAIIPMRRLTPDDYLSAARLIAGCKKDRLPVVINLLEKGGWDIGETANQLSLETSTANIVSKLKQFTDDNGRRLEEISEITGISPAVLRGYRLGLRFPRWERYESIVNAISELMAK